MDILEKSVQKNKSPTFSG